MREIVLFGACAVFTATVGLIVVDQFVMPRYVRQGVQVAVPDLIGLTPAQARARLRGKGLRMKEKDPRWDASVPKGHIVWQNPSAQSRVKPNRTVYVVPSLGGRLHAVPDVRNRSLRQARLWIAQAGLKVGEVTEIPSSKVKEGNVISQVPRVGEKVDKGAPIDLAVSTGPPRAVVDVPRVVELKLEEARRLLISVGLRADNIRYESSTAYEPDVVIRQVPKAGAPIKRGSNVQL
ncbi:MAG: PASTA domain-containing protein, partial [Candidatus Latescibacteria bacterium]|nr:PASTA domain-containing protein [Candidatus Latescibacterota bacterium]